MPKKKKAKVRTLTDEQYNDYLMALKDERPTMLIDEKRKKKASEVNVRSRGKTPRDRKYLILQNISAIL